jgi:hypothetical protein
MDQTVLGLFCPIDEYVVPSISNVGTLCFVVLLVYGKLFFENYLSSTFLTCYFHCDLDFGISLFGNKNIQFFLNFKVS